MLSSSEYKEERPEKNGNSEENVENELYYCGNEEFVGNVLLEEGTEEFVGSMMLVFAEGSKGLLVLDVLFITLFLAARLSQVS